MSGSVSLVGAGPGDPELLTLKAVRRLAAADLVLYDALVPSELLELAPRARRFHVGKRAGRPAISQGTIERLMIRAALRGARVVRLKGGDPFVFGRGAEEALALAAAGIPCEVIPGISSAIAAPLSAGIPVTHRGTSSAFLVVSGHSPSAFQSVLGRLEPCSVTLVVMMGLAQRAAIVTTLLEAGWEASTPAAIVWGAWTPDASVWRGTLQGLPGAGADGLGGTPGTIVIGPVVRVLQDAPGLQRATIASPVALLANSSGAAASRARRTVPPSGRHPAALAVAAGHRCEIS